MLKVKILWINHRDLRHPEAGGAEIRFYEIARRLIEKGHRVTLICERPRGLSNKELLEGIEIIRVGNKVSVHIKAPLYVYDYGREFDVVIDDIAHAVPWYSPIVTKTPVVAQIHHIHQHVLDVELNKVLAWIIKHLEKSMKKIYQNFIAVSDSTKNCLINMLGVDANRIAVVPNGVDLNKYRPGSKDPKPTILWVGRMKKYKRLDHLLKAYKIVKRFIPDAQLVIIGGGDQLEEMILMAKELDLQDVYFLGRVNEEEKIRWMQRAWIITSTSLVEGWGITITEAAACRTLAVAYNVNGIRDFVIDSLTGILVSSGNIHELANAIAKVLRNDKLREYLAENAYRVAQRYDWGRIAERFFEVIKCFSSREIQCV